jgi:hypothetical protein
MGNVGIFLGHLEYFMTILWSFGMHFPCFGIVFLEKSGNAAMP